MADRFIADTSVWVAHFKTQGKSEFQNMLAAGNVYLHTLVFGELLLGGLSTSPEIRNLLTMLPRAKEASCDEVNHFIENRRRQLTKIGWVDAALLASALLTNCKILTLDKALNHAAQTMLR